MTPWRELLRNRWVCGVERGGAPDPLWCQLHTFTPSVRVSMASLRRGGGLTHCPLVVSYPPELAWTKGCHLLTSWLVFLVTRPPRRLSRDPPRVATLEQKHCCPREITKN